MHPYSSLPQPFRAKVHKTIGGCWLWTARQNSTGYGYFWHSGSNVLAHRFSYERLIGPIPTALTLDHLCRKRLCVNPSHLEPMTLRQNILRGVGITARLARLTHCHLGHPFDLFNTHVYRNKRYCRACRQERKRKYRKNKR